MDELILLALQGRATPLQLDELQAWRRQSPEHEARYSELAVIAQLAAMHPEIDHDLPRPTADWILRAEKTPDRKRAASRPPLMRWPALAAAVILGILLGRSQFLERARPVTESAFRTGSGDLASAMLDDGTVVRLAPQTQLRVVLGPETRHVFIDGRAFFAVARDTSRPFRVQTSQGIATALGTRFEVDTREDGFRLLVVDGRVAVNRGDQEVELGAGEIGQTVQGGPTTVTRVSDPAALLDWMGAFVVFESTPLYRVAQELEQRLGIEIEIVDPAIRGRTVTAWFTEEDREHVIRVICRTTSVHCDQSGDVVRMRGQPQE